MEFRLPVLFWGRQRGCLRPVSKIKPLEEGRPLKDMRAKTTSTSLNKASKFIMYPAHYTTYSLAQGPRQSIEVPLVKIDNYNTSKSSKKSHHRSKKTKRQDQLAPPSYENYNAIAQEPKVEGFKSGQWTDEFTAETEDGTISWRAKQERDGAIKYKMIRHPAPPQRIDPRNNISDPANFLGTPEATSIDDWLTTSPPVQEQVEVEESESDDEYEPALEATTHPRTVSVLTTNVPRSGWAVADPQIYMEQQQQQQQQQQFPVHPPERFYEQDQHTSAKYPPSSRKSSHSRRNSFVSTGQSYKPSALEWFFYPKTARKVMQTKRTQYDRVGEWRGQVAPPYDYDHDYYDY